MKAYLIILLLFLNACKEEVKFEDVNADNITTLLKGSFKGVSITEFGDNQFDPYRNYFYFPGDRSFNYPISSKITALGNNGRGETLTDNNTGTTYVFRYQSCTEKASGCLEIEHMTIENYNGVPFAEECIDYLVKEEDYRYSASDRKRGNDILIKKSGDDYLTCAILKKDGVIFSLMFQIWEEK